MKSYDKLLNRYEKFAQIHEALKRIRPRRLYKLTESPIHHMMADGSLSETWFIGILHSCTQSAVKFHLVANDPVIPDNVIGYTILLYKLQHYDIEQLKLTDLPAYMSAPCKTLLYDKILMGKVKILED